jgi:aryl-alcohol dehydrogenase-like predicted oxidoreductase
MGHPLPPDTFLLGGDLPVHRLGFGAMRITGAGVWGPPPNPAATVAVLRRAVELGVTFIDTAESYGPEVSETLIAEALHPYPAGVVVATKGGFDRPGPGQWTINCRPARLRQELDGSLKRLKVDRIDLYQLHRIDPAVPEADQFGTLRAFQQEGKVRHVGLSEVSVDEIERARQVLPIVSVQNRYNFVDRYSEAVLDYCEREGLAFIPWYPLLVGKLGHGNTALGRVARDLGATPAQVALAWLLHRSPVVLPIPGTSSLAHLEENVAAARLALSAEQWASLA